MLMKPSNMFKLTLSSKQEDAARLAHGLGAPIAATLVGSWLHEDTTCGWMLHEVYEGLLLTQPAADKEGQPESARSRPFSQQSRARHRLP